MDVYCTRCGEPWDIDYVRHEEPEGFARCKGVITSCPCCQGKLVQLSPQDKEQLAIIREVSRMFGDDLDGLAAELQDFGLSV